MSDDKEQIIFSLDPGKIYNEVSVPNPTQIRHVDLSEDKMLEPLNAHRIGEGRYGIASFSPEKPYLITYGLSACKAVVMYDPKDHKGLIAHFSAVKDLDKIIKGLFSEFQGTLDEATVCVVVGSSEGTADAAGFGTQERRFWPTPEQLVNDVTTHHPKIILIDDKYNPHPRGIALNLETGEVKEIDNSKGWTWSDQQDTSLNRRIDELEENI
ncbi:hypothetical protein A3C32_03770 [Candidatus Daviesbacteria bacterium RIFCSPHIGHO2_02_FULL_41_14]|nr:MAG: hypothetical protein A2780_00170 [Candidatus Daviesbacteria bacterium RIFCSPHIGHO2_01_FULL_41_45]OGE34439.1 MAG: hypothetical protein A3C32_03770 [Candidatus Daviesbacteria bacterium RIFCSPHIGHO2_02_FULL_41_14]